MENLIHHLRKGLGCPEDAGLHHLRGALGYPEDEDLPMRAKATNNLGSCCQRLVDWPRHDLEGSFSANCELVLGALSLPLSLADVLFDMWKYGTNNLRINVTYAANYVYT